MEKIRLEEIERGLAAGEFFMLYMPTVELDTGCCVGAESLIRWRRGERVVAPGEFIPLIEASPLAGAVTEFVIERVAAELGEWLPRQERVHVAINAPPRTLGRGGLRLAAERSGMMSYIDRIQLEVTERGVTDEVGIEALERARGLGAIVAIDDFGTGDANIVQLTRLDFDVLKIDKVFVDGIGQDGVPSRVLSAVAAFCRELEIDVIAEGVETGAQARCLAELGVAMGQGWHYSKPLPADEFVAFFEARDGG